MNQMNVFLHFRPPSVYSEKTNCVSVCVCVCVFGKGGRARLKEMRLSERPRQSVFFFTAIGAGVCMSPSDRTPFPAIKPSKNIPFVSVTAPTHCSHSAMSVDYVALQFTSATDNIILLIMSYGLLPPSDVCSSAHSLFACLLCSQSLPVRLTGGLLSKSV